MGRSKHTIEQKLKVLQLMEEAKYTIGEICKMYMIGRSAVVSWKVKYETEGVEGLKESATWKPYTKELKESAVRDFVEHGLSIREILAKYQISSQSALKGWVKKYTSHSELTNSKKGMSKTMTKGRPTTTEERIEIAQDCLLNERNYQGTAEKHGVSYQQVYS